MYVGMGDVSRVLPAWILFSSRSLLKRYRQIIVLADDDRGDLGQLQHAPNSAGILFDAECLRIDVYAYKADTAPLQNLRFADPVLINRRRNDHQ